MEEVSIIGVDLAKNVLEVLCSVPEHDSPVPTAVMMPDGRSADGPRRVVQTDLDMSLSKGIGRLQWRVSRIGHLGDFNDLMLLGALRHQDGAGSRGGAAPQGRCASGN